MGQDRENIAKVMGRPNVKEAGSLKSTAKAKVQTMQQGSYN